jgi:hypothetical protein
MIFDFIVFKSNLLRWLTTLLLAWSTLFITSGSLANEGVLSIANVSAAALKAKYTELNEQLVNNQFKRELDLISSESSTNLKGEIYAVVDYPFTTVSTSLNSPEHWCDALILHINIKYCRATGNESNAVLQVNLGTKEEQPLVQTYGVEFNYREMMSTSDYFAVELKAENGPLSTDNYYILIEATPLKNGRTFLHFTYAYAFGFAGRIAMQAYLATGGRNKVGFTQNGKLANGQQAYIKGVRGVVERNTMRYYLAIDAYLSALKAAPQNQFEKRLLQWFNSTEQYAVQLHEVELADYLRMKHSEYLRQQSNNKQTGQ